MVDLNRGIYIITGIMASGKTTIAQLLAEQFDKSVHVHGDVFRKFQYIFFHLFVLRWDN